MTTFSKAVHSDIARAPKSGVHPTHEFPRQPSREIEPNSFPMMSWQTVTARIVPGHQVASGGKADPRFPGGTLRMQAPFFRALGFDLERYHGGTINVSITPRVYRVVKAPTTFRQVQWHPTEPAEDFSFFDIQLIRPQQPSLAGKIYYPHPDTKPEHFQKPDVLELLLPFVDGLKYGDEIELRIPSEQMILEGVTT